MKKILPLVMVCMFIRVTAQNFEGSITWSVSYTIMDSTHKMDGMNPAFPKSFTVQFAKNNLLMTTDGGILPLQMLWLDDKKQYYQIDRSNKTYVLLSPDSGAAKLAGDYRPIVTKTTQTASLLNYPCTKYLIQFKADSSFSQIYWTTTSISIPALRSLPGQSGQALYYDGMEGVPLKMQLSSPQMRLVTEVKAIKKMPLPDSLFMLPASYHEKSR